MKRFLKSKKKFLAVIMVMVFVLTGCSNPRGESGKTYVNSIIASEDVEVKRSQVDLPDDKEIQKKYKDMKPEDIIHIKKTTFGDAMSEGWFNGLIAVSYTHLDVYKRQHLYQSNTSPHLRFYTSYLPFPQSS